MTESIRPEAGVTNSLPPAINLNLSLSQEPREFVLVVVHNQTGRVFSPFLVRSKDEESARKLCRRSYLDIQSVEPFVEEDGKKKPRTLMYGPPI